MPGFKKPNLHFALPDVLTLITAAEHLFFLYTGARFSYINISKWRARAISGYLSFSKEYTKYFVSFMLTITGACFAGYMAGCLGLFALLLHLGLTFLWSLLVLLPLGVLGFPIFLVSMGLMQKISGFQVSRSRGRGGTESFHICSRCGSLVSWSDDRLVKNERNRPCGFRCTCGQEDIVVNRKYL